MKLKRHDAGYDRHNKGLSRSKKESRLKHLRDSAGMKRRNEA
jgi:hypothetical protein